VETLCTRDKNHFGAAKPGNPLFRKKKKKKKPLWSKKNIKKKIKKKKKKKKKKKLVTKHSYSHTPDAVVVP